MKDVAKKITFGEYNQITLDGTNETVETHYRIEP